MRLYEITSELRDLEDLLQHDGPEVTDEMRAEAEAFAAELLDGALPEKVDAYCAWLAGLKAEALALRDEEKRLSARRKAVESKHARGMAALQRGLEVADQVKVKGARFTASLAKLPPRLGLLDEGNIPSGYWLPQPPKLDRSKLLAAVKIHPVAGAQLAAPARKIRIK